MNNPFVYILINGELSMTPGKAAAQAVHSAMMLAETSGHDFLSDYKRTVIVLEAKSSQQIKNLYDYLGEADVDAAYYIDEGMNEVEAYSITSLAVFAGDDENIREMLHSFPLYNGPKTEEQVARNWMMHNLSFNTVKRIRKELSK